MGSAEARAAMVDRLRADGAVRTAAVERAVRAVPRHLFIDHVSTAEAYADDAVIVKTDEAGVGLSSASQPTIVAAMLELTQLEPGHRVLEIGTGTGYNAALLATLVGEAGRVVTVELEPDLAATARRRLLDQGFGNVTVVTGDGVVGRADQAPYDRILVTTGAPRIAAAWIEQLRDGGRLVVPVVRRDGIGSVRVLAKQATGVAELAAVPCGFLPMRGEVGDSA